MIDVYMTGLIFGFYSNFGVRFRLPWLPVLTGLGSSHRLEFTAACVSLSSVSFTRVLVVVQALEVSFVYFYLPCLTSWSSMSHTPACSSHFLSVLISIDLVRTENPPSHSILALAWVQIGQCSTLHLYQSAALSVNAQSMITQAKSISTVRLRRYPSSHWCHCPVRRRSDRLSVCMHTVGPRTPLRLMTGRDGTCGPLIINLWEHSN